VTQQDADEVARQQRHFDSMERERREEQAARTAAERRQFDEFVRRQREREQGATRRPCNAREQQFLDFHNKPRAEVGSQPLSWDPRLAAKATAYAQQLASGLPYAHASRTGRDKTERENLGMGRLGDSPFQIMQSWLNEKPNFVPGIFPNVSKTGDWYNVGHYSQMIWGTTTHVGCGSATGAQWEYLVCRYAPPGNQDGKSVGMASPL
jgi:hypothetical protein